MIAKNFWNQKSIAGIAACLATLLAVLCSDAGIRQARGAPNARPAIRPYALVIGVGDYLHWPAVPQALKNVHKVARALETGGFEVHTIEDPSATELQSALDALVFPVGQVSQRNIVVYYCGQSLSRVQIDGTFMGWIIPRDCPRPDDEPEAFGRMAVSTSRIEAYAEQIKSQRVIMFFDAALAGDTFAIQAPALHIAAVHSNQNARQYIIAGLPDEPVTEHNVFADTIIQALRGQADAVPDGLLTGSELAVFIANQVAQVTHGQVNPQYGKSRNPKFSHGDFVFQKIEMPAQSHLFIQARPPEARIRILNIRPKFTQGISLAPGKYWIEVAAPGHATQRKWITLPLADHGPIRFDLEKIVPITVNTLGMAMKWIDGAEFFMGSPSDEPGRQADEQLHRVRLNDGFRIQTTEVSVGQFSQFIAASGYHTDAEKNSGCWTLDASGRWRLNPAINWKTAGPWMESTGTVRNRMPVTCVSWNDAKAFARWLSDQEDQVYDLPTEIQWELACRAGVQSPFAFGQCLDLRQANYAAAGSYFAHCPNQPEPDHAMLKPITGQRKNKWGLSDMHGNAAEWCRDWYGPYSDTREAAAAMGTERIVRGGHFASSADQCRSAKRFSFKPDAAANVIGFRLVQPTSP